MEQTKFAKALALLAGVVVFSGAISYLIFAWQPPSETPPGGNVDAPINTGATTQSKSGGLNIGKGVAIGTGGAISANDSNKRSLQIATDTGYGGIYNNHSGYLLFSTMPGGWGTSQLHFARSTNWGVYDSSNPTMTLSGANVGIGTTTPSYKLDVAGDIRLTGNGIYNSSGYQLIQGNATDWIRIGNASFTNGAAIYNNIATNGGLAVGTFTKPAAGNITASGSVTATAFYYSSDSNLKKNIAPIENAAQKINSLQGSYFDWKSDGRRSMGLIAQEVETVFPEAIITDENTGLKAVDYAKMVAPLIQAIKEQQQEIDALKASIKELNQK